MGITRPIQGPAFVSARCLQHSCLLKIRPRVTQVIAITKAITAIAARTEILGARIKPQERFHLLKKCTIAH